MEVDADLAAWLAEKINDVHAKHQSTNDGWRLGSFINTMPFQFDYSAYNQSNYEEMWRLNIDLRKAMGEYWVDISQDFEEQVRFCTWVVEDWGGIAGNKSETLRRHVERAKSFRGLDGKSGVASYSKLMSAIDYKRYFILDTRVAVALNALQLEYDNEGRYFFDLVNGQNVTINAFKNSYKSKHYKEIGYNVRPQYVYSYFNKLISAMAEHLGIMGIEVEMMLFDNAENIISDRDRFTQLFIQNRTLYDERLAIKKQAEIVLATERLNAMGYNLAQPVFNKH